MQTRILVRSNGSEKKNYRKLKRGLYHAYDGTGSQKQFVNDLLEDRRGSPLSKQDVLLDSTEYRIVFRDITKFSNERTIVASVIPPDVVCTNTLHTIRPYNIEPAESDLSCKPLHSVYSRVFTDQSLFVALGLINSIPFDYLMREGVIESVTHEDAGCWNCVYERQHPARGDFYRRVLQCNGDRDARVVRAS